MHTVCVCVCVHTDSFDVPYPREPCVYCLSMPQSYVVWSFVLLVRSPLANKYVVDKKANKYVVGKKANKSVVGKKEASHL